MVEVFKTNVQEHDRAKQIMHQLLIHFPHYKINFDLQDCDKILRVEGQLVQATKIIEVVSTSGFECEVLE